jgi:hypothetical protein
MEHRRLRWLVRSMVGTTTVGILILGAAVPASAHAHHASPAHGGTGQLIANGQNHPAFVGGTSCESYGPAAGGPIGPAWYGLESAHHGPDAGTPGKADACYQTTGNVPPGQDVQNPAIT